MIRTFDIVGNRLLETVIPQKNIRSHIANAQWVDVTDPTEEETSLIESLNDNQELFDAEDVEEIESTARYFTSKGNIHIHSLFFHHKDGNATTSTVAFILKDTQLITFRDIDFIDFNIARRFIQSSAIKIDTPIEIMTHILERKIEDLADAVETIYKDLEKVSTDVLEESNEELENTLDLITRQEDKNGKIRLCLMDTQRSVTYLQRHIRHDEKGFQNCREMLRDIETLNGHTKFLFDKINFLMSAAQGFVNIEQNQIIKVLSIATILFLPATLVASIYGMNFDVMPGLHAKYGYYYALAFMGITAGLTYWFFRWKKLL